jgi:hypothetical protein
MPEPQHFYRGNFVASPGSMGSNKISLQQKRESLAFITSNFATISQRKMAKSLGLGKTTVNRWSAEIGLKFKKHTVNESFFDEFNEQSAYLLGLICADGNIAWDPDPKKGYYSLTITASEKDKDHLENMRNLLSSTKPLLYAPKTKSYRLIVNNKKLCRRLMELGVTPRKSLTIQFPDIPEEFLPPFLRGVIDGDGTVYYLNRKRSPYFSVRIYSGSETFLRKLVLTVKNVLKIEGNVRKLGGNVYGVDYSCARGKILAKYVYSGANIFMERKYLPYKNNVLEVG